MGWEVARIDGQEALIRLGDMCLLRGRDKPRMPTAKYPNRKTMKRIQQKTSVQPLGVTNTQSPVSTRNDTIEACIVVHIYINVIHKLWCIKPLTCYGSAPWSLGQTSWTPLLAITETYSLIHTRVKGVHKPPVSITLWMISDRDYGIVYDYGIILKCEYKSRTHTKIHTCRGLSILNTDAWMRAPFTETYWHTIRQNKRILLPDWHSNPQNGPQGVSPCDLLPVTTEMSQRHNISPLPTAQQPSSLYLGEITRGTAPQSQPPWGNGLRIKG